MDSTATAAVDLGLVQGPLGSPGGLSTAQPRVLGCLALRRPADIIRARWHYMYLIINLTLNQTGPSYTPTSGR
jgi:hypothetical protein